MSDTKYDQYPWQVRACILQMSKDAKDWKIVAELLGVDECTAWGWIKAAMDSGDWSGCQRPRGGSKKKLVGAHVDNLVGELAATPEPSLEQMAELIE
ncbi:hypothetical protein PF005_g2450 [Phytophthora fragariae]|uniref:Uncharacterized protein n=1 Tax=Phytophthora fragariae TaxID=53985 RepID=A0A6A3UUN1_9STRA|nr:hypothetical protein PF003_g8545 [Phytophthora fragariae]KAE8946065.1 hypothetical protein PF009_g4310 [Phytophthora fragariae]KAE9025127.1 hypothetical protein PF011_g3172 [Phytophthora fragariae]KAE9135605.1 hypothetical protein PF010_g2033 [Phytophthora fragariae]KAE9135913.1 hypothetical protein PF007_g2396 [Phytophthora fragariae]